MAAACGGLCWVIGIDGPSVHGILGHETVHIYASVRFQLSEANSWYENVACWSAGKYRKALAKANSFCLGVRMSFLTGA